MKKNPRINLPPELASLCDPLSPLEIMLRVLNDDGAPLQLRLEMAKLAAPYVHPKMKDIQTAPPTRYGMDLTKLTTEELVALERMMAKSQIPMPAEDDEDAEELTDGELIARAIESRRR